MGSVFSITRFAAERAETLSLFGVPVSSETRAERKIAAPADLRKERRFMGMPERGTCAAMCNARVAAVGDDRRSDVRVLYVGAPRALTARRLPRYVTGEITRRPPGKNKRRFFQAG